MRGPGHRSLRPTACTRPAGLSGPRRHQWRGSHWWQDALARRPHGDGKCRPAPASAPTAFQPSAFRPSACGDEGEAPAGSSPDARVRALRGFRAVCRFVPCAVFAQPRCQARCNRRPRRHRRTDASVCLSISKSRNGAGKARNQLCEAWKKSFWEALPSTASKIFLLAATILPLNVTRCATRRKVLYGGSMCSPPQTPARSCVVVPSISCCVSPARARFSLPLSTRFLRSWRFARAGPSERTGRPRSSSDAPSSDAPSSDAPSSDASSSDGLHLGSDGLRLGWGATDVGRLPARAVFGGSAHVLHHGTGRNFLPEESAGVLRGVSGEGDEEPAPHGLRPAGAPRLCRGAPHRTGPRTPAACGGLEWDSSRRFVLSAVQSLSSSVSQQFSLSARLVL